MRNLVSNGNGGRTCQTVAGGDTITTVDVSGHVIIQQGTRHLIDRKSSSAGSFRIDLPAKACQLGSSCPLLKGSIAAHVTATPITVKAHATTRENLQCFDDPDAG
jgi:hypothetical protein